MKTLVPMVVFFAVAALSVPADGEILVFKLSEKDISSFLKGRRAVVHRQGKGARLSGA